MTRDEFLTTYTYICIWLHGDQKILIQLVTGRDEIGEEDDDKWDDDLMNDLERRFNKLKRTWETLLSRNVK